MLGKTTAFASFVILTIFIPLSYQLQNLCGNDSTVTHVADPSSCHLFIECERSGSVIIPRFGSCYGQNIDGKDYDFVVTDVDKKVVWCTATDSHCINPLWSCPPDPEHDIMVADPYDTTCRRHRQCRNTSGNFFQCSDSLVFNRNTGLCDLPSNAPCTRVPLPVRCPAGFTGFYPGNTCYQYVYCSNGDILLRLECEPGLYFDETHKSCLLDTNGICPRTKSASEDFMVKN